MEDRVGEIERWVEAKRAGVNAKRPKEGGKREGRRKRTPSLSVDTLRVIDVVGKGLVRFRLEELLGRGLVSVMKIEI